MHVSVTAKGEQQCLWDPAGRSGFFYLKELDLGVRRPGKLKAPQCIRRLPKTVLVTQGQIVHEGKEGADLTATFVL